MTIWQGGAGTPAGYMGTSSANGVVFVDANGIQQADPLQLSYNSATKKFIFPAAGTVETFSGNMIFKPGGTPSVRFATIPSAVNELQLQGAATGGYPYLGAIGSDSDISFGIYSKGAGSVIFYSRTAASPELQILGNGSNSTRWPTITGSNGGNSKIGTTGGGLELSPATKAVYVPGSISDYSLFSPTNAGGVDAQFAANGNTELDIRTVSNHPMVFWTNNTERARINSNGRFETIADSNAHNFAARARAADDFSQIVFTNNAGSALRGVVTVDSSNNFTFSTNSSAQNQFGIVNTAAATRYATVTGAISTGNPKISTTGGSLDVGSPVVFTGQTTGTTVGAAGAASALPANPLGYLTTSINGTACKIPYYN